MDREVLCESLSIWLGTFNVDASSTSMDELTTGVAMAKVLHEIAPAFFTENWMSKIKTDVGGNWRLKTSNLKKILKGIHEFYTDSLGQHIHDFHMPDVNAIGENNNVVELSRLLQLILGCAVNCDNKEEYIQRIMALEESVQHMVMQAIQELMTKETPTTPVEGGPADLSEQLKKATDELHHAVTEKEEYAQRCHELDMQVAALQEEKAVIVADNEKLNERMNMADSLDDPSTPAGRRYQQLQNQLEQLQEEMDRMDASKDDMRIKVEVQEREMLELQQRNAELTALAEEARNMKDEIDVLRHTSDKVAKYEGTIESYKKKLEDMSDLRHQVRLLEEKNTSYMQKNMELEEEARKTQSTKSQLDLYKRQVQELQMKADDETKRADKAEFEAKRMQEKMASVQREKESLMTERDSLRELNEELRCTQAHKDIEGDAVPPSDSLGAELSVALVTDSLGLNAAADMPDGEPGTGDSGSMLELMAVPPEIKEKIMRLQHENKMLLLQRSQQEDEEGQVLQTMLDDANARKNELESELRIANQKNMELEARVEDLQEAAQAGMSSEDTAKIREQLRSSIQDCQSQKTAAQKLTQLLEEKEAQLKETTTAMTTYQEQVMKQQEEMRAMEERYRKYLDKARVLLQSSRQVQDGQPETQRLRAELAEKERLIEQLQKQYEKAMSMKEEEEKLIVSAWYNLGSQLHRKAVDTRLSKGGSGGQSFLARQRQAYTRRTQSSSSPHSGPSR